MNQYSPDTSRALAILAQTLTSQDKVRLMELANNGVVLSEYPQAWRDFVEEFVRKQNKETKILNNLGIIAR